MIQDHHTPHEYEAHERPFCAGCGLDFEVFPDCSRRDDDIGPFCIHDVFIGARSMLDDPTEPAPYVYWHARCRS